MSAERTCDAVAETASLSDVNDDNYRSVIYWSSWWRCCLGHFKNTCDDDDDDDDHCCSGASSSYAVVAWQSTSVYGVGLWDCIWTRIQLRTTIMQP